MPTWKNFKLFVEYVAWAAICGLYPAALFIQASLERYSDPIDWTIAGRMAISGAFAGAVLCAKNRKSLLAPPPEDKP